MEDSGAVFLGAFIGIIIWIAFVIAGPFIFTWAINTVANAEFLNIDSFWDWFVLAILFVVIRLGSSSSKE